MNKIRKWAPILVLILLAPLLGAAKCEEGGGGAGRKQECNLVESQPPKWVAGRGKGLISASVRAYCDPRPKSHVTTVWLEREGSDGKSFFQVGQAAEYDKTSDVPPPGGRDYAVTIGCSDGNWRVRANAVGASSDGIPFNFTLPASDAHIAVIRCRLQ